MKILTVSLLFVFAFLSVAYAVDDASLILYCPFNEGNGDTAKDVKSGLEGKFNGTTKWTDKGKVGNGVEFKAAADYVEFPADKLLDITDQITMEAWILPNEVQADSGLMGRRDSANVGGYCMQWTNGMVEMWIYIGGWQGTRGKQTIQPKTGEWHHVACVYDGKQEIQYVDGKVDIQFDQSGKIGSIDQPFRVGQAQTSLTSMFGIIDEVAVYKRALTEAEIKQDMTKGVIAPVSPAGKLASLWGYVKKSE